MTKKENKKFDNLSQSILTRLSQIENYTKHIHNNFSPPPKLWHLILKRIASFIATACIVIPFTYQINDTLSAKEESLNFKVSTINSLSDTNPTVSYSKSSSDNTYTFSYKIIGDINVYYGTIRDIFLVYKTNNNHEFSETDFYPVTFKNKNKHLNHFIRSIPIIDNFFPKKPLQTISFQQTIIFNSTSQKITKPIYLVLVDRFNNIDISLLSLTGESFIENISNNEHTILSKINKNFIFKNPSLNFYSAQDILKIQNKHSNKNLPLSYKDFINDVSEISSIISEYYFVNKRKG